MAAIPRPVTKTVISTTGWGIPLTDQVNTSTTDIANLKAATTPGPWTAPSFTNGWTNYAGYVTQYRKIGDIVYLRGGVAGGTLGSPIFTLPTGFRPPAGVQLQFLTPSWATAIATVQVDSSGSVFTAGSSGASNLFVGMSFQFSIT